jgi:hypothetical protein
VGVAHLHEHHSSNPVNCTRNAIQITRLLLVGIGLQGVSQPILDSIAGIASIAYDGNRILPGEALPYSCTPLAEIAPFVAGAYLNRATARYSAPNDVHFIDVTAGVQQGDVFGSTLFCAGLHPLLCRLMDRHPEVTCIAYADNVTFIGKLSLAWAALDEFNKLARCLHRRCG